MSNIKTDKEITAERIKYDIIQNHLGDFEVFLKYIKKLLK